MTGWKLFFIAAALFNFAAGVPLLVAPHEALALMQLPPVADVMYHQVSGVAIICFGVGYGIVAGDLTSNHGIVWMGIGGKIGIVLLMAQAYAAGAIPFQAFSIVLGDFSFVVGFIAFLLTRPRAA